MNARTLYSCLRRICLALPETEESSRLGGEPHFYVAGRIFAGCGKEDGAARMGVKVGKERQRELVQNDGYHIARYVGRHGWISVDAAAIADAEQVRELVLQSYRLIAPRRALVAAGMAAPVPGGRRRRG